MNNQRSQHLPKADNVPEETLGILQQLPHLIIRISSCEWTVVPHFTDFLLGFTTSLKDSSILHRTTL